MRAVDGETLYERACDLEAQALAYVGKIANDESKIEEWKIWSAILAERTTFKHDVFDAPTIEPERKMGKWNFIGYQMFECTECGTCYTQNQFHQMRVMLNDPEFPNFCPKCGADMRAERRTDE